MDLQVLTDRPSLQAAREAAAETDRARIEHCYRRIREGTAREPGEPKDRRPWLDVPQAEILLLLRNHGEVIPELRSIAEGFAGESESARLFAGVLLGKLDPALGFQALKPWLYSNDPDVLWDLLDELEPLSPVLEADRSALTWNEADTARVLELVHYPDRMVGVCAIELLGKLRPAGAIEHLQEWLDDPDLGAAIRRAIADADHDPQPLEDAFRALAIPGREAEDHQSQAIIGEYLLSRDPLLAARAREICAMLAEAPSLLPAERDRTQQWRKTNEHRVAVEAARSADLQRAAAAIDRLVATAILDRAEGDEALSALRTDRDGNWFQSNLWGLLAAFQAAQVVVEFRSERDDPPGFEIFLRQLADASRGAFTPEAIDQPLDIDLEEEFFPVQFIQRDRLYRVLTQWRGRGNDAESVVSAVNVALGDAGEVRRFIEARVWLSGIHYVFADPDRLRAVAPEIGLVLTPVPEPDRISPAPLPDPRHARIWREIRDLLPEEFRGLAEADLARATTETGRTALHQAASCTSGRGELIEALAAAGSDVNAEDCSGWTPLHVAASDDQSETASALIDRGAFLRARDDRGFTPLHTAANSHAAAAAALLLERGVPVDVRTTRSRVTERMLNSERSAATMVGDLLELAGRPIGGKVEEGQTPLHRASFRGAAQVAALLLDRGADVDAQDARLQTPLHLAVSQGKGEVAELLRARGANALLQDEQGRTANARSGEQEIEERRSLRKLRWIVRGLSALPILLAPFHLARRAWQACKPSRRRSSS